jgi:hypothetical protein
LPQFNIGIILGLGEGGGEREGGTGVYRDCVLTSGRSLSKQVNEKFVLVNGIKSSSMPQIFVNRFSGMKYSRKDNGGPSPANRISKQPRTNN